MKYLFSVLMLASLVISGCSSDPKNNGLKNTTQTKLTKLVKPIDNAIIKKGEPLEIQLELKENAAEKLDSIGVYFDDKFLKNFDKAKSTLSIDIDKSRMGKNNLFVKVFKSDGSRENKLARLKILSEKAPKKYGFEVVNE